jgi:hypothetical protein
LPITVLAFFFGWLYGTYTNPYTKPYISFSNHPATRQNQTLPITSCLCDQYYSACECDRDDNSSFLTSLVEDDDPIDSDVGKTATINGIFINGTLDNAGGTAAAADPSASATPTVEGLHLKVYFVMIALVGCAFWLL